MKAPLGFIIVLLILCASMGLSQAQTDLLDDAALQQYLAGQSSLFASPSGSAGVGLITQQGMHNEALIQQIQSGSPTAPNVAVVAQFTDWNQATVTQNGHGNATATTQEGGTNNTITVDIQGSYDASVVLQHGTGNIVDQHLTGEGIGIVLTQWGNNNEVQQHEDGAYTKQYRVSQFGDGMKVVITNLGH